MPMHSKEKKEKDPSVGVEFRAGGDPHKSEKPGWSASSGLNKNSIGILVSLTGVLLLIFQLIQWQQNDDFNYDLFKVAKWLFENACQYSACFSYY